MKIELHAHTSQVSPCGKMSAEELVDRFCRAGYDALVVTDHLVGRPEAEETPDERAEAYLAGYRAARQAGERRGMKVFLGAEIRFPSRPEDILVYGLEEADIPWLTALVDSDPGHRDFHEAIRARGLICVQAHPFRRGLRPIPQEYLDGVEVYNGNPRHNSHNDLAMFYGRRGGMGFLRTSGSDAHQPQDVARGGIVCPKLLQSNKELLAFLLETPDPKRIVTIDP